MENYIKIESVRKIVREILLEDYYDYWRDYKAGTIDKETYDRLVRDLERQEKSRSKHPYALFKDRIRQYGSSRLYLDIPYSQKDTFKKKYYGIRWDPTKKSWYTEIPNTKIKYTDELKNIINKNLTSTKTLSFVQ